MRLALLNAGIFHRFSLVCLTLGLMALGTPATTGFGETVTYNKVFLGANLDALGRTLVVGDINGDQQTDIFFAGCGPCGLAKEEPAPEFHHVYGLLSAPYSGEMTFDFGTDTPDFTAVGTTTCGSFAIGLAVGDLDGDAIDDLVFTEEYYHESEGRIYVLRGRTDLSLPIEIDTVIADAELEIGPSDNLTYLGRSLAIADVNGDGYGDLITGAHYDDGETFDHESLAIYAGSADFFSSMGGTPSPDTVIIAEESGGDFGNPVAALDVDGDGFADILSAESTREFAPGDLAGAFYVIHGDAGLLNKPLRHLGDKPAALSIYGGADNASLGDAFTFVPATQTEPAMILVTDSRATVDDRSGCGAVYGFALPDLATKTVVDLNSENPDFLLYGAAPYHSIGTSVAVSHDVQSNRTLWVGASNASVDGAYGNGEVFVLSGQLLDSATTDLGDTSPIARYSGENDGDQFGNFILAADFDGSGSEDIAISAWYGQVEGRADAGKVYFLADPFAASDDDDDSATDDDDSAIDDDDIDDDDTVVADDDDAATDDDDNADQTAGNDDDDDSAGCCG